MRDLRRATSDQVQGLVPHERTFLATIEIARDVARKLIESQSGACTARLLPASEAFAYSLIIMI